jgi:hypothetical protein
VFNGIDPAAKREPAGRLQARDFEKLFSSNASCHVKYYSRFADAPSGDTPPINPAATAVRKLVTVEVTTDKSFHGRFRLVRIKT